ncbi:hypothetical protein NoPa_00059 [Pseudomonas phage vB_PpuM-NoPa]|uniref:Uncharacterized protein n=2 Tax=Tartuvirus TaxID=3424912 RepID=A0AAX4MXB5_9CAUD
MWPFKKKEKKKLPVRMFDMDKIKELESLTPEQIIRLVCAAFGNTPERVIIWSEIHHSVTPITKEVYV